MSMVIRELLNPAIPRHLEVVLNDQVLGQIDRVEGQVYARWHAQIRVPGAPPLYTLAQGHGDTPEEALADAFVASQAAMEQYLTALAQLKAQLYPDEGDES